MHKLLHGLFFLVLFIFCSTRTAAQVVRGIEPDNGPVSNIAPLPKQVNPEDIQKPDPSTGEKKQQNILNTSGTTKKLQPTTTDPSTVAAPQLSAPTEIIAGQQNAASFPEQHAVASEKLSPTVAAFDQVLTFPDLQVNAIQEAPTQQQFYGTEKTPGSAAFKTDGPAAGDRVVPESTPPRPTNGKLEFLRQYAEDLKLQIEQNTRNPDYPSEAKKKELAELETLLQKQ